MSSDSNAIDNVQSHILGVIAGLMVSFDLNSDQVKAQYDYVSQLDPASRLYYYKDSEYYNQSSNSDEESNNQERQSSTFGIYTGSNESWADMCDSDVSSEHANQSEEELDSENNMIFVSTRREFCNAMQNGIRICPRYSTCEDQTCTNFHIETKNICSHVTRGSYCDNDDCDLIVIRACRKGKKCTDADCSFRH